MFFRKNKTILLGLTLILSLVVPNLAQKPGDGTISQRLEIMRQKLDTMRKSLANAISTLKDDAKEVKDDKNKKDNKSNLETPLGRLQSLDKEVSKMQSEVSNLRGKVDRSEKYDSSDIDQAELAVGELNMRVDTALTETATQRSQPKSTVGEKREVKKKGKFLGLFGGGNDEYEQLIGEVTPGRDRELFIVATREIRKSNYEVGRLLFQTIITTYPDSPYLPMAKLAVADSFYLEGESSNLIQAAAGYQDWLTFFPTHPLADKVLLKIAECEMRQIGLPDRDSTRAKRAEQRLKAFFQQYPNSSVAKEAEKRMQEVQDNLGLHNLNIANYYYTLSVSQQKQGLKGAQSRYREILEKYPNFTFMDEPLYKIAVTYQIEEETDEAIKYYQRLVRDYPYSDYVEKAKEQLRLMGASIPLPNPEKKDMLPPEKQSFITNFKNQFFGIYPMTIDKNGVLMTKDFDKTKFELIDQIIENQGDLTVGQIPKSLSTIIKEVPKDKQEK
ncbi:MAG: outer membrane protein assembly factor BamD [Pyrinomonadaceae bacterium]|nr:outer membrane protein assembly factor BamD [Pyrinomonadaceae bacterium]